MTVDPLQRMQPSSGPLVAGPAAAHGNLKAAQLCLAAAPETATAADEQGGTPLMAAAQGVHVELVRLLIKAGGADSALLPHTRGYTALHSAATKGHAEVAQELLVACPRAAEARNRFGWTPMHTAAFEGSCKIVQLLLLHAPQTASARGGTRTSNERGVSVQLLAPGGLCMLALLHGASPLLVTRHLSPLLRSC